MNGDAVFDMVNGTAAALAEAATPGLMPGQEAMPIIFLCGAMIDEAVDGFMRDEALSVCARELPSDLLGRPAHEEAGVDIGLQGKVTREFETIIPVSPPFSEMLGTGRFITTGPDFGRRTVTLQFPADRAGGTIQSFGNGTE